MKNKIQKIRLESGEEIYIRKGWDGYRVVYPNRKNPSESFKFSNINWKNFLIGGHWSWLLKLLFFLILLYVFVQMYLHDTAVCREFVEQIKNNSNLISSIVNYDGGLNLSVNIT